MDLVSVSEIEFAKLLKAARDRLSKGDFGEFRRVLGTLVPLSRLDRIVAGMSEEDEFALLCALMGTTSHCVRLEQGPSPTGDYITPDLLVRFQPGCSVAGYAANMSDGVGCLIDVKSTAKVRHKIGGKALSRRKDIAKAFGLRLLFAVRFTRFGGHAFWVVMDSEDFVKGPVKVKVNDLVGGVRHVIWDEHYYMLRPGTVFRTVYDKEANDTGAYDPDHGGIREFRIIAAGVDIQFEGSQAATNSLLFECFRPAPIGATEAGTRTVVDSHPQLPGVALADMVYQANHRLSDDSGNTLYEPSKILARMDRPEPHPLVTRHIVETWAGLFLGRGVLFRLSVGDQEEHVRKWVRYGGRIEKAG